MLEILKRTRLFAFDLDGTLYMGENIIKGAIELIEYLRQQYKIAFFTNNSSKTKQEIHDKLNRLGIACELQEVFTSSSAMSLYLKETGIDNIYVIGSESFRSELKNNGFQIVDNDSAEHLIVGYDCNFSYKKIADALMVLLGGGMFIACNEDGSFPIGENKLLPGCGAMVGAVASSSGREPDFIVGKPNTYILSKIADTYGVSNYEIVVVGDSYESDIAMALRYQSNAILIGSLPDHDSSHKNVLVKKDIYEILRLIKEQ